MGRLIDAEVFINWLDCGHLRHPSEKCLSELDVKQMIKNQPTAYDVDKVIEQISKASDHYECEEQGREDVYMVDTEIAIDLVKGGGQG